MNTPSARVALADLCPTIRNTYLKLSYPNPKGSPTGLM